MQPDATAPAGRPAGSGSRPNTVESSRRASSAAARELPVQKPEHDDVRRVDGATSSSSPPLRSDVLDVTRPATRIDNATRLPATSRLSSTRAARRDRTRPRPREASPRSIVNRSAGKPRTSQIHQARPSSSQPRLQLTSASPANTRRMRRAAGAASRRSSARPHASVVDDAAIFEKGFLLPLDLRTSIESSD